MSGGERRFQKGKYIKLLAEYGKQYDACRIMPQPVTEDTNVKQGGAELKVRGLKNKMRIA